MRYLKKSKAELDDKKLLYNPSIKVGVMIEVPSAVLLAEHLAKMCDFFSIGTNDLIQYSLAVNRVNKRVAYLYDPLNPAVLNLVYMTIQAAHNAGIGVAMCGEMASDPWVIWLLLAMGLNEFSVSPKFVGSIKEYVSNIDISNLQIYVKQVLGLSTGSEVRNMAEDIVKRYNLPIWQKK